jgi:lipoprotein-anchoring transpeptidase ErfK/SrfK
MKTRRLSVSPVVLSFLVVVLSGLVWWAGSPARAAFAPTIALVPVWGIVSAQPENVVFSGQAQVSSELVRDTSKFRKPPSVILIIDLSNVSGTGSSTGATYAAGGTGTSVFRKLVSTDTVEITFPFSRGTTTNMSLVHTAVASFALTFDLNTGAITKGTATVAAPSIPN